VQERSSSDVLTVKNEQVTPTYDEDSTSSVDAQPIKAPVSLSLVSHTL